VSINYEKDQISFYNPDQFHYSGSGKVIPFELARFAPLVKGEIDGIPGIFEIDTGARSTLLLTGSFIEKNNLRERYKPQAEGVTGWGIGGPIRAQITRAKTFKLGEIDIKSPATLLSLQKGGTLSVSTTSGLIGWGVLRQFNLVFDYSRKQMIFEKNKYYGLPDVFDRMGMWISSSENGRHFEVYDVVAHGPAEIAGIKAGDKILAIDDENVQGMSLPNVRSQMNNAIGKEKVKLLVESEGKSRDVVLVLKDIV